VHVSIETEMQKSKVQVHLKKQESWRMDSSRYEDWNQSAIVKMDEAAQTWTATFIVI
jgi:hypothetical protein